MAIGPLNLLKLRQFYPQIDKFKLISDYANGVMLEKKEVLAQRLQNNGTLICAAHYLGHKNGMPAIYRMNRVLGIDSSKRRISFPYIENARKIRKIGGVVLVIPFSTGYQSNKIFDVISLRTKSLIESGYSVYVNSKEKIPSFDDRCNYVYYGLKELYYLAAQSDLIVGIRSGILDFLAGCKTKIEVYMQDDYYGHYLGTIFDLSMWGGDVDNRFV